jgi:hypothetical protein
MEESQMNAQDTRLIPFSEWYQKRGIARSTAFKLLQTVGITPEKQRSATSRTPINALNPDQLGQLNKYADRLLDGETMTQLSASLIHGNEHEHRVCLAELIEVLPLPRGSVFELIRVLGITTIKGSGPGNRGRVAWLSGVDAERLANAAARVNRGEVRICDLQNPLGGLPEKVLGLDLSKVTLPDAIAAMVDAWYQAQEVNNCALEALPDDRT